MIRFLRPLPVLCFLAFTLTPFANAAEEPVVIQAPPEGSNMKLFEFAGGSPEQLITELKKTFGSFNSTAVMMTDQTGGEPLPPIKTFASNAEKAIESGLKSRVQFLYGDNLLTLQFTGIPLDPFAGKPSDAPPAAKPEPEKSVHFRFPGGTPLELVAALDSAFGSELAAITTISPEVQGIHISALQMKAAGVTEVLGHLNKLSRECAGTCGCWLLMDRDGSNPSGLEEAAVLMVTPLYNERNPSPAVVAMNAAAGPEVRMMRELEKKITALENSLQTANQSLQQMQEKMSAPQPKAP